MNTTRHALSLNEYSAPDALFDKIEQDLLALSIAPLDGLADAPRQCVDEFADDFFSYWSTPPAQMHSSR
jgi:hypothetical protein